MHVATHASELLQQSDQSSLDSIYLVINFKPTCLHSDFYITAMHGERVDIIVIARPFFLNYSNKPI